MVRFTFKHIYIYISLQQCKSAVTSENSVAELACASGSVVVRAQINTEGPPQFYSLKMDPGAEQARDVDVGHERSEAGLVFPR